jgi:hypothetical protein
MARRAKDAMAEAVARHPTRVQALATLPVAMPGAMLSAAVTACVDCRQGNGVHLSLDPASSCQARLGRGARRCVDLMGQAKPLAEDVL